VIWIIISTIAFLAIALVILYTSRPEPVHLPSPNGYDDLITAVPLVVPNQGFWRTQSVAELQAVLNQNSNALTIVRGALDKQWAAPVSYDSNYIFAMISNVTAVKVLAQMFCAEGRMAELDHRTNEALKSYIQCIQLGQKCTHGALMIQDLVGIACKAMGHQAAQGIWPLLDDVSLQIFLDRLTEIDHSNDSADESIRRDHDWSRGSLGLRYFWTSLFQRGSLREVEERFRARHLRSEAEIRLLHADIAIELFRRKNERYPSSLSELVPACVNTVPLDPFSGQPLIYRVTTNSYLLYSIGPDRKDDGGKPLVPLGSTPATLTFGSADVGAGDLISTPPPKP
jgi:hypothetical protein